MEGYRTQGPQTEVIAGAWVEVCMLLVRIQRIGAWLVPRAQASLPVRGGSELGLGE